MWRRASAWGARPVLCPVGRTGAPTQVCVGCGALRWQRGRRTKGDPARIFGNGTQATCIRPTGSKSWGRRQPFVQVRWTSLCGEMAERDGPALAVRSPRAHSPLHHGACEPDADHASDRPPCVAGSRPSMRYAVRAHAHRSRSSRTLRRAATGSTSRRRRATSKKEMCAAIALPTPSNRAHT